MSDSVSICVDDIATPSIVCKVFDSETLGLDLRSDLIGRSLRMGVFQGLGLSSATMPISSEDHLNFFAKCVKGFVGARTLGILRVAQNDTFRSYGFDEG